MCKTVIAALIAAGAVASADFAVADIIYDNGAPNPATGGVLSDLEASVRAGDDFILQPGANTITGIQWWGFHLEMPTAADDFTITIYEMAGEQPAALPLHSLSVGSVSRLELEPLVYGYEVAIAPLGLTAGRTYALSIYNRSAAGSADDWSWFTSGEGAGFQWLATEPPGAISRDFAFVLTGPVIPGPGAAALWTVPLIVGAGHRRRGRRI